MQSRRVSFHEPQHGGRGFCSWGDVGSACAAFCLERVRRCLVRHRATQVLNASTIAIFCAFFLRKHCMRAKKYLTSYDERAAAAKSPPRGRSLITAARLSIVALAFSDDAISPQLRVRPGVPQLVVNPMRLGRAPAPRGAVVDAK